MENRRNDWRRYRPVILALGVSLLAHGVALVGVPSREALDRGVVASYTATLDTRAVLVQEGASENTAAPAPVPRPARAKPRPKAPAAFDPLPQLASAAGYGLPALAEAPVIEAVGEPVSKTSAQPERIALAQPAAPIPALEPPRFPEKALPASLSISYQINSAFADGRATYEWTRDGDSYRIAGEAEATGFFTLFLEGQILQESRGSVTAQGLRPERFREKRPGGADEGLAFDWGARQVTFDRGAEKRVSPLADNTVDWLSMIFQLAHSPPTAESLDMQVFTQRRMYRFNLKVIGVEEIDIPLGRVRALHLRHSPADEKEAVDVWLGIDQHNLPVKLRFPVAKNRLMVEQVATSVRAR